MRAPGRFLRQFRRIGWCVGTLHAMSEDKNHEVPREYTYAVGAGLGLFGGVIVGLFMDQIVPAVLIGLTFGIVIAWGVRLFKP